MERCVTNKLQHKTGNINTKHWKTHDYSSRSAGWNTQVPPVKAIWWEPPVYLLPTNHLAQAWSRSSRSRPNVTVLSNTCAGKSYTWPYTLSYVTARPYCCTWRRRILSITSVPPARPYAGCWGLMFMCWGCPSKPMRCFCFLCSVIWKNTEDRLQCTIRPTWAVHVLSPWPGLGAWQSIVLIDPFIQSV